MAKRKTKRARRGDGMFGKRLRLAREARHLSQHELARRLEVDPRGQRVWNDGEGRKRTVGVVGDLEHAGLLVGESALFGLLEYDLSELWRFAAFIQQYALGREFLALAERHTRPERRSRRAA